MSTPTEPTQGNNVVPGPERVNDADLGAPTWIESSIGFPMGGLGASEVRADRSEIGLDPGDVISTSNGHDFTGHHAGLVIAFAEFLAGVAFESSERRWLIDAMAGEYHKDPELALTELAKIERAVRAIPGLTPTERANNRYLALTSLYRTEPFREELGMPETPIMKLVKAHNPALLTHKTGVVVVADALEARHAINELVLTLAGHDLRSQPYLRAELTEQYRSAPITLKAELAGSQVRLVVLREWLATMAQDQLDRLRARLTEVIDTATDLDLVTLQLSFRSMLEADWASSES